MFARRYNGDPKIKLKMVMLDNELHCRHIKHQVKWTSTKVISHLPCLVRLNQTHFSFPLGAVCLCRCNQTQV